MAIDELRSGDGLIQVHRGPDRQASQWERDQPAADLRLNLHALADRLCDGEHAARLAEAIAPHLPPPAADLTPPTLTHEPLTHEQRAALRRDWEQARTAEAQTGKLQVFEDGAVYVPGLASLADQLMPLLLKRLRGAAPAEAKAMAGAAAEVPGLDALACNALADWLEERGMQLAGAKVRTLAVRDGDLLVVEVPFLLNASQRQAIRSNLEQTLAKLRGRGVHAECLILEDGITMKSFRTGKREEGT